MAHQHDEDFIRVLARRILGSDEAARQWLARPNLELGGRAPGEMIQDEDSIRRLEELLRQLDDAQRLHGP